MTIVNEPNSQNDVITTVTHVLLAFEDIVQAEMPGCQAIYDEELSYESAIRNLVAKGNFTESNIANLPVLIYNRSPLKQNTWGMGMRLRNYSTPLVLPNGSALIYRPLSGEFDINFLYVSKSIEMVEKFEVAYLSEEGISKSKELIVRMADLGDFNYFALYQELTDKPIVKEDVYYKGIAGSITVRGTFFTFIASSSIIKEINARIFASRSTKLVEDIINAQQPELKPVVGTNDPVPLQEITAPKLVEKREPKHLKETHDKHSNEELDRKQVKA